MTDEVLTDNQKSEASWAELVPQCLIAGISGLADSNYRKSNRLSLSVRRYAVTALFCLSICLMLKQSMTEPTSSGEASSGIPDWLPTSLFVQAVYNSVYIGDNDPGNCDTMGSAFDKDTYTTTSSNMVVGGTTSSKSLMLGKDVNACLSKPVPFLMKYTDGEKVWEKYFGHSVYKFDISNDPGFYSDIKAVKYPRQSCSSCNTNSVNFVSAVLEFKDSTDSL